MRDKGIDVDEVNYAKKPLDAAQIRQIIEAAGSVAAVVNKRHALVKERGWLEREPKVDDFVRAALADPNVLRRPVFIRGKSVLIGFDKSNRAEWDKLA